MIAIAVVTIRQEEGERGGERKAGDGGRWTGSFGFEIRTILDIAIISNRIRCQVFVFHLQNQ